ncbi:MAG: hypothetical protein R3297_03085, partial [Desulfobulbales bacterium]|nr:hypothetical protein [Desulfobulbales bacterium]
VEGTLSGVLADATVDVLYTVANVLSFTINSGSTDFVAGDTFTFNTTRDPGLGIRDIWIDPANDQLYAATYFDGAQEPHPVGNVYSHAIADATGDFGAAADWVYANDGLPQYDPPDDTSLFPQYVFAADDPINPTQLYIGGAGINFYKALSSGLAAGAPAWKPSKNGLTNLIMARMPILFTDLVTLDVYVNHYLTFDGENFISNADFKFYVEDPLGNPPIAGSTMTVKLCLATQGDCSNVVFLKEYGEEYTSGGTFRDPSDPSTNRPFGLSLGNLDGQKVIFIFEPTCTLPESPGCSGAKQEEAYTF